MNNQKCTVNDAMSMIACFKIHQSGSGWSPVYVEDNLSLMSAGFLLPSLDAAVIWRGPKKNGLIKQLLRDVDWAPSGNSFVSIEFDDVASVQRYIRHKMYL